MIKHWLLWHLQPIDFCPFSCIIHHVNLTFAKVLNSLAKGICSSALGIPSPEPAPEQTPELCWTKSHSGAKGYLKSSHHQPQVGCHADLIIWPFLNLLTFCNNSVTPSPLSSNLSSLPAPTLASCMSQSKIKSSCGRIQCPIPNLPGSVLLQLPPSCYNRGGSLWHEVRFSTHTLVPSSPMVTGTFIVHCPFTAIPSSSSSL